MQLHLRGDLAAGRPDLGCVADAGLFSFDVDIQSHQPQSASSAATRFVFELIARLLELATFLMLEIRAYAKHIP
jgi:hypothetical protein